MEHLSRKLNKVAGKLLAKACEVELGEHLEKLESSFQDWKEECCSAVELARKIKSFSMGPARRILDVYSGGDRQLLVARAVAFGYLQPEELPRELHDLVEGSVEALRKVNGL